MTSFCQNGLMVIRLSHSLLCLFKCLNTFLRCKIRLDWNFLFQGKGINARVKLMWNCLSYRRNWLENILTLVIWYITEVNERQKFMKYFKIKQRVINNMNVNRRIFPFISIMNVNGESFTVCALSGQIFGKNNVLSSIMFLKERRTYWNGK